MTSKQVTSPPWNSRRLVHSKEMAWASRWSVALRAFYRQILSSSNCKDFFFKWHRPPRKLAKEVFVKFIPAKEKTRFAKEWRKVLAKDHVIRIDSHEVFNTAHIANWVIMWYRSHLLREPGKFLHWLVAEIQLATRDVPLLGTKIYTRPAGTLADDLFLQVGYVKVWNPVNYGTH